MKTIYERRRSIIQIVKEHGSVRVPELAETLDVSEGTVRNDLLALHEDGQLMRVRGGAVAMEAASEPTYKISQRAQINLDSKRRLARWASGMVEGGAVILMDASTTVLAMADYLRDRDNLTVVTNGIELARRMSQNPSNTVILPGGMLRTDGNALIGALGERLLRDLHIHTAFVSCTGFSPNSGFMENDIQEVEMKRHMLQAASKTVMLVDASKWGKVGLTPFAGFDAIDYLVTDNDIPPALLATLRSSNIHVTICGENTTQNYSVSGNGALKIGFGNLSEDSPFGRDVRRSLERAAQSHRNIELILADNQLDSDTALAVADHLIDRQVDLAIEFQIDEQLNNVLAHRFKSSGIPVIAVDIPMVGATFFGVDNYAAGKLAGRALGEAIQTEWAGKMDNLIVLEHPRAGLLTASRIQGQLDGVHEILPDISPDAIIRIDSGNTAEISYENMSDVLRMLPDRHQLGVICFNDDAVIGALRATQRFSRESDVLIVGQGADRLVRAELRKQGSRIVGSTAFKPEQYGERLLDLALKILHGEPVPPAVYTNHTFISAENVDTYYPHDEER